MDNRDRKCTFAHRPASRMWDVLRNARSLRAKHSTMMVLHRLHGLHGDRRGPAVKKEAAAAAAAAGMSAI